MSIRNDLVKYWDTAMAKELTTKRTLNGGPKLSKERTLTKPDYTESSFTKRVMGKFNRTSK